MSEFTPDEVNRMQNHTNWIRCPICGSEDAYLDASTGERHFECPDCSASCTS